MAEGLKGDPVRYAVLGSGSSANAYIFQTGDFSVLVDNGFSCRELLSRAEKFGFDPSCIRYILLTHIHGDHLRGVEVLSRKLKIPVIRHEELNLTARCRGPLGGQIPVRPGEKTVLGPLVIHPFETSHDAPFSVSYALELWGARFCLITDTGQISRRMSLYARHSDVLFLEANYCDRMLEEGPYPWHLKRRIASEQGHLSNRAALDFLNHLAEGKPSRLSRVFLCHLSGTNNDPEVVEELLSRELRWKGDFRVCAKGTAHPGEFPPSREPSSG